MKAIRMLSVLGLAVAGLLAAGCTEKYSITVVNTSDELQDISITESGGFPVTECAAAPNGGRGYCTIKQDADASLGYVIKTNKLSQAFVINRNSPSPMFFMVSDDKITGPFDKETRVSEKTEKARTEQIYRGPKVE